MDLRKYTNAQVLGLIRHYMRALPSDNYSNRDIDASRTEQNYNLAPSRGETAKEINKWRQNLIEEKDVYKSGRKDLINAIDICVTAPADIVPGQEYDFFRCIYNFLNSRYGGEDFVISAIVHKDEGVKNKDGNIIAGRAHMHYFFIPVVKVAANTNPKFEMSKHAYKLSAHDLTTKKQLYTLHPAAQKWLDEHGVQGTVYKGGGGKNIEVDKLKEITKTTGLTLDQIKDLAQENVHLRSELEQTRSQLAEKMHEKSVEPTREWGQSWDRDWNTKTKENEREVHL